ncbi:MAG: L-threonylcarbamoyladenylate synthase [Peptostreptococcaceae bacterium]|jgi:L-threonylcarbamoyladenylate synthase|nr:L-threonylcarbamoyladenylate synthase [Peptostreptococcaceae bacterium]
MKNTIIKQMDENAVKIDDIKIFANILKEKGTVIFPTETVYGIGANALDVESAKKIYEAKGRPSDNPLICHIGKKNQVYDIAREVDEKSKALIEEFWPGPLTIILKKKEHVPSITTGGLDTVAIRMPKNNIANALLRESNIVVAAPSANISGRPSPTTPEHVISEMDGRVDGIIVSKICDVGLESTVIDMTLDIPTILRPGKITLTDLKKILKNVIIDPAILKKEENLIAKAPGMKYTHYSPNAKITIIRKKDKNIDEKIKELILNQEQNLNIAIMCMEDDYKKYQNLNSLVFNLGKNLDEVAKNLFYTLKKLDDNKVDLAYCPYFEGEEISIAIMNRLLKASGYRVLES